MKVPRKDDVLWHSLLVSRQQVSWTSKNVKFAFLCRFLWIFVITDKHTAQQTCSCCVIICWFFIKNSNNRVVTYHLYWLYWLTCLKWGRYGAIKTISVTDIICELGRETFSWKLCCLTDSQTGSVGLKDYISMLRLFLPKYWLYYTLTF